MLLTRVASRSVKGQAELDARSKLLKNVIFFVCLELILIEAPSELTERMSVVNAVVLFMHKLLRKQSIHVCIVYTDTYLLHLGVVVNPPY